MVVLDLDENNKGEGTLGFALKLKFNPETKQLEIENYGTDPVQLKNVRKMDWWSISNKYPIWSPISFQNALVF